jgi:hypothetical protein
VTCRVAALNEELVDGLYLCSREAVISVGVIQILECGNVRGRWRQMHRVGRMEYCQDRNTEN